MSEASAASASPFGKVERTLAWRYLRAKRENGGASLISIISFVGIFFAVAALIITMSIMSGFRATLMDAFLGGQPHIYANVEGYTAEEADEIAKRIREVAGIESVTPSIEEFVLATAGDRKAAAIVRAVAPADVSMFDFLSDGRTDPIEAGYGTGKNGGNVIMAGLYLALGREGLLVGEGDKITLLSDRTKATVSGNTPVKKTYTVGKIFETGSVELDRLYVFMPLEQAQLFFGMKDRYGRLDIRLKDPYKVPELLPKINDATGYSVALGNWMDDRKEYLNALRIERTMVRLLVMVIMGIATLNIIVGVVMLVKNKSRDIAILRTIGLSKGAVMRVFMMVGTVLGTLGALLGVLVGVLVVLNIGAVEGFINIFVEGKVFDAETYGLSHLPAILDWNEVIRTALYAIGMSALVSLIPSWWASNQDPVEALRFE